jgi:6-phosphofructokinase
MGLFDMIKKLHPESRLFGFLNGPHGIYSNNYMEITQDYMGLFRNTGGFDMIRKCHEVQARQNKANLHTHQRRYFVTTR